MLKILFNNKIKNETTTLHLPNMDNVIQNMAKDGKVEIRLETTMLSLYFVMCIEFYETSDCECIKCKKYFIVNLNSENIVSVYLDQVAFSWNEIFFYKNGKSFIQDVYNMDSTYSEFVKIQRDKKNCINKESIYDYLKFWKNNFVGFNMKKGLMYTHQGNTLTMTTFVKKVKVFSMSFGHEHFLVLINHGIMSCGSGSRGQLGHGNNENCTKPKFIDFFGGLNITSISAGGWHSAAISAGVLYLWGWNNFGQLALENKSLGNNHVSISNFPEAVETNDTDWISVKCGSSCTFALNENGKIYSWGFNKYLQLLRQTNLDLFSYIPTELTISNPKKMDSKNEPKILKSSVETRILNYTSNCWISCLLIQDVCVNCTD